MAVDAVYLFDEKKSIRSVIVWDVYELIHDEATYELDAEIAAHYNAKPGEFLGFYGIDEKFLLFEIDKAETDDKRGVILITATDASVKELASLVVPEIRMTAATSSEAAHAALDGSGWELGRVTSGGRTADLSHYYDKRWKVLREIAVQYQARVTPYFEFVKSKIARRIVDVTERENIYRGRLFEGATGASQIFVTYSGSPVVKMYGVGKAIGTEDPPTCVTFKDIEWSKAKGDPADKPVGQDYIIDPEALAAYGEGREDVFTDKNIEDQGELLEATWAHLQKMKRPKISGTATMSEMEHIPGYEHMIARIWDLVWVRTRQGVDISAVAINIKRNYLRRGMTKIMVGEESDDSGLIKKIAKMSSKTNALDRSAAAQANRYIETKRLIQLNADTIQMNARLIEANAQTIHLTASNLKKYEEGTDKRLTAAELLLYGDGTGAVAGLVARVDQNAAALILQANELGTLARVKADKIELIGLVTASELSAELANINKFFAGNAAAARIIASEMSATHLSAGSSFKFINDNVYWMTHSIITGGRISIGSTYANYPVYQNGVKIGSVNIPSTWDFTPTYGTKISYMGKQT